MLSEADCEAFDRADPLRGFRARFAYPHPGPAARDVVYLCGHSLGLMPLQARDDVASVLDAWASLGVEGHFDGADPWYRYDDALTPSMAALVGAKASGGQGTFAAGSASPPTRWSDRPPSRPPSCGCSRCSRRT